MKPGRAGAGGPSQLVPALLRGASWQRVTLALSVTVGTILLRETIGEPPPNSTVAFLTPVLLGVTLSALIAGPLAGILATILAALASLFLFLHPQHEWGIANWFDAVQLSVLVIVGFSISWLAAVFRAALRRETATAATLADRQEEIRRTLQVLESQVRSGSIELENREVEMVNLAAALRDSEERFRLIFDSSPEAIFLIDPHSGRTDWPIVEANDAACRMNGYERRELIGHSIDLLNLQPGTPEERLQYLNRLRTGGAMRVRTSHRRKDGSVFPIETSTSLVHLDGRELVLGVDRDMTERERQEAALQHQAAALAATNTELAARNAEQETFIYTVSHDLRSPLLAIRGMSTVLDEAVAENNAEEVRYSLRRIAANVDKMTSLLDDLLVLSRTARPAERAEDLDLAEVATAVLTEMESRIQATAARVELSGDWPLVRVARTDAYQVLANLLGNAIKFASAAGHAPVVAVTATSEGSAVTLRVSDNGPGVLPAYRERVFGLFQRLDSTAEGTGVGLAIVKRVAERYAGRAWLEDSPFGGVTVAVTLPAVPVRQPARSQQASASN
jgi:PAS domain S-box-containing protein